MKFPPPVPEHDEIGEALHLHAKLQVLPWILGLSGATFSRSDCLLCSAKDVRRVCFSTRPWQCCIILNTAPPYWSTYDSRKDDILWEKCLQTSRWLHDFHMISKPSNKLITSLISLSFWVRDRAKSPTKVLWLNFTWQKAQSVLADPHHPLF